MNKWTLAESWDNGKIWSPITATIKTKWDTQAEAQEWADKMEEAFKGLGTFRDGYRIKVVAPN